jgi:Manganese containing catalase
VAPAIARLLEGAPMSVQEAAAKDNPVLAAIYGGMNPQTLVVNGAGASPQDSMGNPWSGAFVTSSGNLLADFHLNATAEMQGRLQVARLWHKTDDPGRARADEAAAHPRPHAPDAVARRDPRAGGRRPATRGCTARRRRRRRRASSARSVTR